jgi:hypothetical protein
MAFRQVTLGFDKAIDVAKIVKILAAHFDDVEMGQGVTVNGLPENTIYIHNKGGKTRVGRKR